MNKLVEVHLNKLKSYTNKEELEPNFRFGKKLKTFGEKFLSNQPKQAQHMLGERILRFDVFDMVRSGEVETKAACLAIMAWGGMRLNHRDLLFVKEQSEWLNVAEKIRNRHLDRVEAYKRFSELRRDGKMQGVGPAFFTKLIYFLMLDDCKNPGYVMDQWTACSVNLLSGVKIVHMHTYQTWVVSDKNDYSNYSSFCNFMDKLRFELDLSRHELDRALFCKGGRKKGPWREHVINHRQEQR